MEFIVKSKSNNSQARTALLKTNHGEIHTPAFMPVGTQGTVKAMTPADLNSIGAEIVLGNTFHLYLRPGHEIIRDMGGIQKFMGWNKPVLTDSGGYQVFSLSTLINLTDEGIFFKSPLDGSKHFLSPEKAIQIQLALGSDIIMVLDECLSYPSDRNKTIKSVNLTTSWANRCKVEWNKSQQKGALFGIVQGSIFEDLRLEAVEKLLQFDFDGYALGGLSVGEPKEELLKVVETTAPKLPSDKPRYLMGVGTPQDILNCVERGIDLFDCVIPTRHARNGSLFTSQGTINIKNSCYINDKNPLDPNCECYVCKNFSRAYLSHLYRAKEILSSQLNTYHNLYFYLNLMKKIRLSIENDSLKDFSKKFLQKYLLT